jgi:radical SAM protein with 4Fe4S-binding SPASM domain
MTVAQIRRVFEKIKPFTDYVYLHVKGEPLIQVNITTNGVLVSKVSEMLLNKKSLRQINFSMHSFEENSKKNNASSYFDDIFKYTEKAINQTDTIVSFRLWNLDFDNNINLPKQKNREILQKIETHFSSPIIDEKLTPGRGVRLRERLFVNFEPRFEWPDLHSDIVSEQGFCYGLRTHIGILADGSVVPCCLDAEGVMTLGNIFQQDLSTIVESERAQNIYRGFTENKAVEDLCKKCLFKNL